MLNDYDVFDRHQVVFDVVIQLLSPLSHIGESVGNQSNLKTLNITDLEGVSNQVFVYSGNALRNGVLRRRGVDSFLESLGIQVKPEVHQTLFAGGYIDGGTACDLELDKKIRQLLPPVSVLGTAKPKGVFGSNDAQMVNGRLAVGDAVLVCYESAEYIYKYFPPAIPEDILHGLQQVVEAKLLVQNERVESWLKRKERSQSLESDYRALLREWQPFLEEKLRPYTQWLTWNQKVRMDSLKSTDLQRHLIGHESDKQLNLLSGTKEKTKKNDTKQQMIMGDWLIQQGATLYSRWSASVTNVEEGFIADALLKFAENPYLGGKSGTGCGLVSVDIYSTVKNESEHWLHLSPNSHVAGDRASSNHQRYLNYLEDYKKYLTDLTEGKEVKGFLGL